MIDLPSTVVASQERGNVILLCHEIGDRHWYEAIDKKTKKRIKWLSSVTHYTGKLPEDKTGLLKHYGKLGYEGAQADMKACGVIGTKSHKAEELLNKGEELLREDYQEDVWGPHLVPYTAWAKRMKPEFLSSEELVYDIELGLSGTLDCCVRFPPDVCRKMKIPEKDIGDGIVAVGDSKTARSGIRESMFFQVNKYLYMRNNNSKKGDPLAEWVFLINTNTDHRTETVRVLKNGRTSVAGPSESGAGYQMILMKASLDMNIIFDSFKPVVDYFYPEKEPKIPIELPNTLSI